ncbi:hypothetical protein MASR2M29_20460 [Spirochaetota bacterium]
MKTRFKKFIASLLLLSHFASILPAQDMAFELNQGRIRLVKFLERASLESSQEKWQRLAESALLAAMNAWESSSLYLKESGEESYMEKRALAEAVYKEETDKSYMRWAVNKYLQEKAALERSALGEALRNAANDWLYFDEKRPGGSRQVEAADFETAKMQWAGKADMIAEEYISDFENKKLLALSELISRFRASGLKEDMYMEILDACNNSYSGFITSECKRIAFMEQNRLMIDLMYDQKSLKRMNASLAAGFIAGEMAREAELATDEATKKLFASLNTFMEAGEHENIDLDISGWLEQFRMVFEEGLRKWEKAECEFLATRADWERDAQEVYLKNEKTWMDAYAELNKKQYNWEKEFVAQIDRAQEEWLQKRESLSEEILTVRNEFLKASEESRKSKETMLKIQMEIYDKSRSMMASASHGMKSWYMIWASKYKNTFNYWQAQNENPGHEGKEGHLKNLEGQNGIFYLEQALADPDLDELFKNGHEGITKLREVMASWKDAYLGMLIDVYNKVCSSLLEELSGSNPSANKEQKTVLYEKLLAKQGVITGLNADMNALAIEQSLELIRTEIGNANFENLFSGSLVFDRALWDSIFVILDENTGWLKIASNYHQQAAAAIENIYLLSGLNAAKMDMWDKESFDYKNELEAECIKARAVLKYWEEELYVISALDDYVQNNSSLLESASTTKHDLQNARNEYLDSLAVYKNAVDGLSEKGLELDYANEALSNAQSVLDNLRVAVDAARDEYCFFLSRLKEVETDALVESTVKLLYSLQNLWTENVDQSASIQNAMLAYLWDLHAYEQAVKQDALQEQARYLVYGNSNYPDTVDACSIEELEALQSRMELMQEWTIEAIAANVSDFYPDDLQTEKLLLKAMCTAYSENLPFLQSAEKAGLELGIRQLWSLSAACYKNKIEERNEALSYVTGHDLYALDEYSMRVLNTRCWLYGQQLGIINELDNSGMQKPELIDLKNKITELLGINNNQDFMKQLGILRDSDQLVSKLARQENVLGLLSSALAWSKYHDEMEASGYLQALRTKKIMDAYANLCLPQINQNGNSCYGELTRLLESEWQNVLNMASYNSEAEAFIQKLRNAGDGLAEAGKQALEFCIQGIIEYLAVNDFYRDRETISQKIESNMQYYDDISSLYNKYTCMRYDIYSLHSLVELMGDKEYKALEKGEKGAFQKSAAILIMIELGENALSECRSIEDYDRLIGNIGFTWLDSYSSLDTEDKLAILDSMAEIHKNSEKDKSFDSYAEWHKKLADIKTAEDSINLEEEYAGNEKIKVFYSAQKFLTAYRELIMELEYADKNHAALYLEAFINTKRYEDIDSLANCAGPWINELLDTLNNNPETACKLDELLLVFLAEGNNIPEAFERLFEHLKNLAIAQSNDPEQQVYWQGAWLDLPSVKQKLAILEADYGAWLKKTRQEEFNTLAAENNWQVFTDELANGCFGIASSEFLPFYLAGKELFYTFLSSPQGYCYLELLLPLLDKMDREAYKKLESYYLKKRYTEAYSAMADGDISEWLLGYSDGTAETMMNSGPRKLLSHDEICSVFDSLSYGLDISGLEYFRKNEQERLFSNNCELLNLVLLGNRNRMNAVIETKIADYAEKCQEAADRMQYALFLEHEADNDRSAWMRELSKHLTKDNVYNAIAFDDDAFLASLLLAKEANTETIILENVLKQAETKKMVLLENAFLFALPVIHNPENNPGSKACLESMLASREEFFKTGSSEWFVRKAIGSNVDMLRIKTLSMTQLEEEFKNANDSLTEKILNLENYYSEQFLPISEAASRKYLSYNAEVDRCKRLYDSMRLARLEFRKMQEINEWAESIYLKDFGSNLSENHKSPKERHNETIYSYERSKCALQVLEALLSSSAQETNLEYSLLMDAYKNADSSYYMGRVVEFDAKNRIAIQETRLKEAEQDEYNSRIMLVSGPDKFMAVQQKHNDLVMVEKTGEGKFRLNLAYELGSSGLINIYDTRPDENAFYEYFNFYDQESGIQGMNKKLSMAEHDAMEWLDYMHSKGRPYFEELLLASLYLKSLGSEEDRQAWFSGEADPNFQGGSGDYNLGHIPLSHSFHSEDIAGLFLNARFEVMKAAYNGLVSSGNGKNDLASYLLFREYKLVGNFPEEEKLILETRAIDKICHDLNKSKKQNIVAGANATGLGFALTMAAIPFNLYLLIPAAAAYILAGTFIYKASAISEAITDLEAVKDGKDKILADKKTLFDRNYENWLSKRDRLAKEQKELNKLLYGSEQASPNGQGGAASIISYEVFIDGVEETLQSGGSGIGRAEISKLFDKKDFDETVSGKAFTITACLELCNQKFETARTDAFYELQAEKQKLVSLQSEAAKNFYDRVNENLKMDKELEKQLHKLAMEAANPEKNADERKLAARQYDELFSCSVFVKSELEHELYELAKAAWGEACWNSVWNDSSIIMHDNSLINSFARYSRETEPFILDKQQDLLGAIISAMQNAEAIRLETIGKECELLRLDFDRQYSAWDAQLLEIQSLAAKEWDAARGKFNRSYNNWRSQFEDEYKGITAEWQESYQEFSEAKMQWIDSQYLYAANAGNAGLLEQSTADIEFAIGNAMTKTARKIIGTKEGLQSAEYVAKLLADTRLLALMDHSANFASLENFAALPLQSVQKRHSAAESMALAQTVIMDINKDMRQAAAKLAAEQANNLLEETQRLFFERLEQENKSMWDWERSMVLNSGYSIANEISRSAVVASTVFGAVRDRQTVHFYRYFYADSPEMAVRLDAAAVDGLDASVIMHMVYAAQNDMAAWAQKIFGSADGKGQAIQLYIPRLTLENSEAWSYALEQQASKSNKKSERFVQLQDKMKNSSYDSLSAAEKDEYAKLSREIANVREGEFGKHIGYAPVFKNCMDFEKSRSFNVEDEGYGQMGLILLDFQWNEMLAAYAYAELARPMYDQKMWMEGAVPGFAAPSVRDVVAIASEIIGSVTGQKWLSYADELLFAGLDLGGGYRTPEEVGMQLAKKVLSEISGNALGFATGKLGNMLGNALSESSKAINFLVQAELSVTAAFTGAAMNNYIAAMDLGRLGSAEWMDWNAVKAGWSGSGIISSALQAGISGGLAGINLRDANGYSLAAGTFNTMDIQSLNYLAGAMGGSALSMLMTGNASFNLASIYGVGVLEVNMGIDGINGKLGTGGTNISYQKIMSAAGGLRESSKLMDWKYGGLEKSSTLNAINMLSYTQSALNRQIAGDIWKGKQNHVYACTEGYGEYDIDKDIISLNMSLLGKGKESSAKLATVLAHEGTHASGIRIEGLAHLQGFGSYNELQSCFRLDADVAFKDAMLQAIKNPEHWIENSGNIDYWKLMEDGSLLYDKDGWLKDSKGNFIVDAKNKRIGDDAIEGGLLKIFGLEDNKKNRDLVYAMLERTGMTEKEKDIWWKHQDNEGKFISLDDIEYKHYYDSLLTDHNTLNIYNALVANGSMDLNPAYVDANSKWWIRGLNALGMDKISGQFVTEDKYISYEQYKANNFIQGLPVVNESMPAKLGSMINTMFGASGGKFLHRGLDFLVLKEDVLPVFVNDTTIAKVFFGDEYAATAQGHHVDLLTKVSYTFKGQERTDTIVQRMLHLDSVAVSNEQNIANAIILGKSGNSGYWNGKYGYHLHTDLYTGNTGSPWLNYVGSQAQQNITGANGIKDPYTYKSDKNVYYDPMIFLYKYEYGVSADAYKYF